MYKVVMEEFLHLIGEHLVLVDLILELILVQEEHHQLLMVLVGLEGLE